MSNPSPPSIPPPKPTPSRPNAAFPHLSSDSKPTLKDVGRLLKEGKAKNVIIMVNLSQLTSEVSLLSLSLIELSMMLGRSGDFYWSWYSRFQITRYGVVWQSSEIRSTLVRLFPLSFVGPLSFSSCSLRWRGDWTVQKLFSILNTSKNGPRLSTLSQKNYSQSFRISLTLSLYFVCLSSSSEHYWRVEYPESVQETSIPLPHITFWNYCKTKVY